MREHVLHCRDRAGRDWTRWTGQDGTGLRVQAKLQAWFTWAVARSVPLEKPLQLFETWIAKIRGILDDAKKIELKMPCPLCGEVYAWTDDDEPVRNIAVVIVAREPVGESTAQCRACLEPIPIRDLIDAA